MNTPRLILSLIFLFATSSIMYAQNNSKPQIGCKDGNLLVQNNELKQSLTQQGFEVQNDAMLTMESRTDFPVVVRMQAGTFYQIVFMGNTRSKRMELDLYAPDQQPIMQKEQQPLYQTSNVISFSFTPSVDGDYTFILNQTLKQQLLKPKESTCGSFSILRLKKTK